MNQYPSSGQGASGYMPPAPNFPQANYPGPQQNQFPAAQNGPSQGYSQGSRQPGGGQVTQPCYNCGSMQHWAQHCTEPRRPIPAGAQKQPHGAQPQTQPQQQPQQPQQQQGGGGNQQQKKKRGPGPIITRYPVPPTAGQPGFGIPQRPPFVPAGFPPGFQGAPPAAPFNPQFQAPFNQPYQQPYAAPQQMPPQGFMPPQANFGYGQAPMAANFAPPFNNPQQGGRFNNNNNNRRGGGHNQRGGGGRYNPYPNPQQMGPYNHPPPAVGGYQNMGGNRQMGGQYSQGQMRQNNRNRRQGQHNQNRGPGWKPPQQANKPLGATFDQTKAQDQAQNKEGEKSAENNTDALKDPALATKSEILGGSASVNGKGKRTHAESEGTDDTSAKRVKTDATDAEEKKADQPEKTLSNDKTDDDLENFELEDSDAHPSTTVGNKKPNVTERSGTPNLDDEDLLADDLDDSSRKPVKSDSAEQNSPTITDKISEDEHKESEKGTDDKVDQLAE